MHNKYIHDIVLLGRKSEYWDKIETGKMNHTIELYNPFNEKYHIVKMAISVKKIYCNKIIFNIKITDSSAIDIVINKTGLLTHDLRAVIKCAQNITTDIKTLNGNDNFEIAKRITNLSEVLIEAYNMCIRPRASLLPQNSPSRNKMNEYNCIKMYLVIPRMVKTLNNIYNPINITFRINTKLKIQKSYLDALWHLLLNMIKNSKNANASEINIDVQDNDNKIMMVISDNGRDITNKQIDSFFNRILPSIVIDRSIDSNRGEGFLLSYQEWKKCGGSIRILKSELNKGYLLVDKK